MVLKPDRDRISLKEARAAGLAERIEQKFLVSASVYDQFFSRLPDNYKLVDIKGHIWCRYSNLYFDTQNYTMYQDHLRGKADRCKIRIRKYVETKTFYGEIKRKTNKKQTLKKRIKLEIPDEHFGLSDHELARMINKRTPYSAQALQVSAKTHYNRLTLVRDDFQERITIDKNLKVHFGSDEHSFPGMAIIELKRPKGASQNSPAALILKEMGIRPAKISKYCLGVSMLIPGQRINTQLLRNVAKIIDSEEVYGESPIRRHFSMAQK